MTDTLNGMPGQRIAERFAMLRYKVDKDQVLDYLVRGERGEADQVHYVYGTQGDLWLALCETGFARSRIRWGKTGATCEVCRGVYTLLKEHRGWRKR